MKTLDTDTQEGLEALAKLISTVDKHADGEETARQMLESVGVLRSVYEMERIDLKRQPGMKRNSVEAVTLVEGIKRVVELEDFPGHISVKTFDRASAYLRALMNGRHVEYCYLMCINHAGNLIRCPLLQRGTVDQAAVYAREIALTAMREEAVYAVLSHNHPGGTLEPSPADIQVTIDAITALRAVNVAMLDHIIVTDTNAVSIRALRKPAESFWLKGRENDKILKRWNVS